MRSRAAMASVWAIVGGAAQNAITFLILIYLAHVLHPRDFGLMSIVAIALDLGSLVARWGQVELLQQDRFKDDHVLNASFWMSAAIALLFTLAALATARPVAMAFGAGPLEWMILLSAPVFLLNGCSVVPEALLRREMRFRLLATRSTVTTLLSGVVAILLAYRGYGAVTLAAQRLVQALALQAWNWTSIAWRPRPRGGGARVRGLFKEGASVMIGTMLPMLVPRSVDLLVGVTLGPAKLGLMRIAFRVYDLLAQIVIMPLVSVSISQLGRVKSDPAELSRLYLRYTQVSAALICPLLVGFGIVADDAVPLLFGHQWVGSVVLVRIIAVSALVAPVNYFFSAVMVSVGQSARVLRQGLFQLVAGLILSGIAIRYSIVAVLIAQVARAMMVSVYNVIDLRRHVGIALAALGRAFAPAFAGTAAMACCAIGFRIAAAGRIAVLPDLIGAVLAGMLGYAAVIALGERLSWWSGTLSTIATLIRPRRPATERATGLATPQ